MKIILRREDILERFRDRAISLIRVQDLKPDVQDPIIEGMKTYTEHGRVEKEWKVNDVIEISGGSLQWEDPVLCNKRTTLSLLGVGLLAVGAVVVLKKNPDLPRRFVDRVKCFGINTMACARALGSRIRVAVSKLTRSV